MRKRGNAISPKQAYNVSINHKSLTETRRHSTNLSQALADTPPALIRDKQRESWLRQNGAAIKAYNRRIEEDGVFSEGLRTF